MSRQVVFLLNLLQDVNIVRPLVLLAAKELRLPVHLLVSEGLLERDSRGLWQSELHELQQLTGARLDTYDSEFEALRLLAGGHGVIVAASESDLRAHAMTHNVFRVAPTGYLRVTLQHGYECPGFLQNRDHDKAHGRSIGFGADVICGWCDLSVMQSVAAPERSKYMLTGPAALLNPRPAPSGNAAVGLVCENLHSARMSVSGDFKASFMDTFFAFCKRLAEAGKKATLRPHPGGQYVVKNNVPLPDNVVLNNDPMYRVDLRQYRYGISAPSSVVIDMVLAGIPTAVWLDEDGRMDGSHYRGLHTISTLDDWLAFERDALLEPASFIERQQRFLERTRMLLEPDEIGRRFARLLAGDQGAGALSTPEPSAEEAAQPSEQTRVLYIANALIPTLQLSFLKPLGEDVARGAMQWRLISGEDIKKKQAELKAQSQPVEAELKAWLDRAVDEFAPTQVVFCRYSDRFAKHLLERLRARGVPVVFHIDDDLLNVPIEIGEAKYRMHNAPERLATVDLLLRESDLVYCSTEPLLRRFRELGFTTPMFAGKVYCAGSILNPVVLRPVTRIGYMGFDHAHDLEMILPAVVHILRSQPQVTFELFGSIPKPPELAEFGDRVKVVPPVRVYAEFLQAFAELQWDIGLCPLVATPFNRVKANTKWVEYTSVGAAVVASRNMVYDDCCADDCGILAETLDDWIEALERLCASPQERFDLVRNAQARLQSEYSDASLRDQVLDVFRRAQKLASPQ